MSRGGLNRYAAALVALENNPREALAWVYESKDAIDKLAAWNHLRVAGDIFDEDLGEEIEKPTEVKVETFDDWVAKENLTDTKWFAIGDPPRPWGMYVALGRKGSNLIFIVILKEMKGWQVGMTKSIPINKDLGKNLNEFLNKYYGPRKVRWNLIDKLTEKTLKFRKGGDVATLDALVHGGLAKGSANRAPIIDLIFDRVQVKNLKDALLDEEDNNYRNYTMQVQISINGRVWTLDPDTIKNLGQEYLGVFRTKSKESTNEKRSINVNKNIRFMYLGTMFNFCSWLLGRLTREESSLFIALTQAEEYFLATESKKNGVLWLW